MGGGLTSHADLMFEIFPSTLPDQFTQNVCGKEITSFLVMFAEQMPPESFFCLVSLSSAQRSSRTAVVMGSPCAALKAPLSQDGDGHMSSCTDRPHDLQAK